MHQINLPRETSSVASILLLIIVFFFTSSTDLQSQNFRGGFRGGIVASEVSGDKLASPNKIGYFASAFANFPLSRYESLQGEIMFIEKGSRSWPSEENDYYDYRFALQYAEIPLLFVQDLSRYTSLDYLRNVLFHGGLSASFLINSEEKEDGFSIKDEDQDTFHDAELNLLIGFSYPLGESLYFNFGYSNSITPIRPHVGEQTTWRDYGQYNTLWTLGLAMYFW